MSTLSLVGISILVLLGLLTIYDLRQRRHAILRNFPIIGHLRPVWPTTSSPCARNCSR